MKEFGFETNTLNDLEAGKIDFAITSPEEVLLARDKGQKIVAVAAYFQVSPHVIVTLTKSGIKTPADFRNRMLGVKGGKAEEFLIYELVLGSVGMTNKNATIKKIGFEDLEWEDLIKGRADTINLYRTDQLYYFEKNEVEYSVIYPEQFGVNVFNDVLVVREDFLESNQEVIRGFLKASVRGWEKAIENPELAIKDTMKYVTISEYKDVDYERYILRESLPLVKPGTYSEIGYMNMGKWEKLFDQMKKSGFIKGDFEVNEIFTNKYL